MKLFLQILVFTISVSSTKVFALTLQPGETVPIGGTSITCSAGGSSAQMVRHCCRITTINDGEQSTLWIDGVDVANLSAWRDSTKTSNFAILSDRAHAVCGDKIEYGDGHNSVTDGECNSQ